MISKYFLAAKTHTIQQIACSVTLHSDLVRIWSCRFIITASLTLFSFFNAVRYFFFQMCNVNLCTLQLPTHSWVTRPKAEMFRIWLYGLWQHVGLCISDKLVPNLSTSKAKAAGSSGILIPTASLHSATTKTTIWTIPNTKSGNRKFK